MSADLLHVAGLIVALSRDEPTDHEDGSWA